MKQIISNLKQSKELKIGKTIFKCFSIRLLQKIKEQEKKKIY